MSTYTYTDVLHVLECANCNMTFAITEAFERSRRRDHLSFYCPSGHVNYYPQETKEEKLRRSLNNANARAVHLSDQLESERRSKAALKGHLTRMRRRISNGVCPWCDRHFANVENHVHHMHPEHIGKLEEVMSTT